MEFTRILKDSYCRHRFACLFYSLLLTLIVAPLFSAMGLHLRLMEVFLGINVLAAVLTTLFGFGTRTGLGLLVLVFGTRVFHAMLDYKPLLETTQGLSALVCLATALILLRYVLGEGPVTSERIFAALDIYLLLGVMCGLLFSFFEELLPGSFSFHGSLPAGNDRSLLSHTLYFSFVTLGTLGYGDITPVGGYVRALAVAEAICGQMYLVVVVAWLVSMYGAEGSRNGHDAPDESKPADVLQERKESGNAGPCKTALKSGSLPVKGSSSNSSART